jgi:GMP synthase-like glutamine amidotransferase
MILIISTCKEKLHELEFVKPVYQLLSEPFLVRHYSKIKKDDLKVADKVVICGTSLGDDAFFNEIKGFSWLKKFEKPVLGICAGMQIIGLVFGGSLFQEKEIGFYKEKFNHNFLGLVGEEEVYHLHNNYVSFGEDFLSYTDTEIFQAVKHKNKEIYGCLFHPEVRNKEVIENFCLKK